MKYNTTSESSETLRGIVDEAPSYKTKQTESNHHFITRTKQAEIETVFKREPEQEQNQQPIQ